MKLRPLLLLVMAVFAGIATPSRADSLVTAPVGFLYQGSLNDGAGPATGSYDLSFTLYDAGSNGTWIGSLTNVATVVSNGLFTATLSFPTAFEGTNYWLEIAARTNGNNPFTPLSPRQQLLPTPQAIYAINAGRAETATTAVSAHSVSGASISGTISDAQLSPNVALLNGPNTFTASQVVNGSVTATGFAGNFGGGTNLPLTGLQSGGAANAQLLTWNGSRWAPSNAPAGGGQAITATNLSAAISQSLWVAAGNGTGSGGNLTLNAGNAGIPSGGAGGNLNLLAGNAMPSGGSGYGGLGAAGAVNILAGNGYNNVGGNVLLQSGGNSPWTLTPNSFSKVSMQGGTINAGDGAVIDVEGGHNTQYGSPPQYSAGGNVKITAGNATGAYSGGNIILSPGTGSPIGKVGIGNTSPATALDVNGTVTATAFSGNAVGLTNLTTANLTGTIADARLSANVALLTNPTNTFSGAVMASSFTGNGVLAYQTVAGTTQSAAANAGYVLTNAEQITVTLPTTASAGDLVRVLGTGAGGWQVQAGDTQSLLGGNAYGPAGATWTARESNRPWYSPASSADGVKLVAGAVGDRIYTSTDSGVTWTARESNRVWNSVASSADGVKLVATDSGGRIYTSTDSGATWTARESSRVWTCIASSADGAKLIAGVYEGQLYTSTDSGVTWTARETNRGWHTVASSADGTKLVAGGNGGGGGGTDRIYTSTDSGVSWTAREDSRDWRQFASSSDGTKLVAVTYYDRIYTSTDSGVTWTPRESSRNWNSVASSADGTRLVALDYFGRIYTSTDSGVTWTARESSRIWNGVASSADGTKLVAVEDGGQIYTSVGASIFAGASGTASGFQYLGNNTWQAVVESSAASASSVAAANLTGTLTTAQVPNLDASKIASGTFADARLSANVALLNSANTFSGNQTVSGTVTANGFSGNLSGGTNLPLMGLQSGGAANAQVLTWNGMSWVPSNSPTGGGSGGGLATSGGSGTNENLYGTTTFNGPMTATNLSAATSQSLVVAAGKGTGSGGSLTLNAGDAGVTSGGAGGNLNLQSGSALPQGGVGYSGQGPAGIVNISAGGGYNGVGGNVIVKSGPNSPWSLTPNGYSKVSLQGGTLNAGDAASVDVEGGHNPLSNGSSVSAGGNVKITAGNAAGAYSGGHILLMPGTGSPSGNVGIGKTSPATALDVNGTVTATAFNPSSDRSLKENFAPVSPRDVLEKVAAMPISRWNFIGDPAAPHFGPMAQDFHSAFGLGADERHIATVDADGVALAAIQGLNQKLNDKDAEIQDLKRSVADLKELVRSLGERK